MRGVIIVLVVVVLLFVVVLAIGSRGGDQGYDSENYWVGLLRDWVPAQQVARHEIEDHSGCYREGVFTLRPGAPCRAKIRAGDPARTLTLAFVGAAGPGVRVVYQPDSRDENAFAFDQKQLKEKPFKLQVAEHGGTLTLTNGGPAQVRVEVVEKR